MKKLKDEVNLAGKLEVITMTELRSHPGDVFDQVALGKSFCVKRRGAILGFIVPPECADVSHVVAKDGTCDTLNPR